MSARELEEQNVKAKHMRDLDGNLYFDEEGKSIESVESTDPMDNGSQSGMVPQKNLAD